MTEKSPSLTLQQAFESTFHSKYRFEDFLATTASTDARSVVLRKGTTNETTVYIASDKLRRFHKFLNRFVFDYLDINTQVAFAYLPGKNTRIAIEKHASNKYFFQTDFAKFFSSLNSSDVRNAISRCDKGPISDLHQYQELTGC